MHTSAMMLNTSTSTRVARQAAKASLRTYMGPVCRNRSTLKVKAYRDDEGRGRKEKYDTYSGKTGNMYSGNKAYGGLDTQDASSQLRDAVDKLQARWDEVQYKKTVITLLAGSAIGAIFFSQILGAVDKLPLIPDFLTFVGLVYSASFTWRYLVFKSGRQELRGNVQDLYNNIKDAVEGEGITPSPPTSLMGGDDGLLDDVGNAAKKVPGVTKGSTGAYPANNPPVVGGGFVTPVDPVAQPGESAGSKETPSSGYIGYAQPGTGKGKQ